MLTDDQIKGVMQMSVSMDQMQDLEKQVDDFLYPHHIASNSDTLKLIKEVKEVIQKHISLLYQKAKSL